MEIGLWEEAWKVKDNDSILSHECPIRTGAGSRFQQNTDPVLFLTPSLPDLSLFTSPALHDPVTTPKTSHTRTYAHTSQATMPRQRSAGRAPARPTVAPRAAPAPQAQQTRPAATYAPAQQAPQQHAAPAPQASQGPGLFGQMASTAAGVAIGSSIGHAIGGMFSGGSSAPAEQPQQQAVNTQQQQNQWGNNCAGATQNFTKCMDENQGNMQICGWYLEQLKACQAAASQY
ncbi:hypothetical protein BX600DRAFT_437326 [Xylariales sp. PMI_506]|nr:hypothetical protein BX600DRAFT_437326 [Xylariales sp. PMI_506]